MATTLAQIREALRSVLDAGTTATQVSAYALSSPTPPCIIVGGPDDEAGISYHAPVGASMQGGTMRWNIPVTVYVGLPTDRGAQVLLDTFIDPTGSKSIHAIIGAARTLGDVVQDALVMHCTGYRLFQPFGVNTTYLGATFTVQIQASAKES